MREILLAVMVLGCSVACVTEGAEPPSVVNGVERPNVVFIFSDQQHYQAMMLRSSSKDDLTAEFSIVVSRITNSLSKSRSSSVLTC